eukprot:2621869-Rhodomonas_salina.2
MCIGTCGWPRESQHSSCRRCHYQHKRQHCYSQQHRCHGQTEAKGRPAPQEYTSVQHWAAARAAQAVDCTAAPFPAAADAAAAASDSAQEWGEEAVEAVPETAVAET